MHLSIIVCAYNEETIIRNKIKDMLDTDKNSQADEIIVVDDNSSDKTFEIACDYSKNIKKLMVIKNVNKKGKWGALATGFNCARNRIICITDADVTFQEDTIEEALKLFDNPLVGGVTSNQKVASMKGGKESEPSVNLYEKFRNFFRAFESKIDSTTAFHGQCMFFRKACLKLAEDNLMADDLAIAIRIRRNGYRTVFCKDSYYIEKIPVLFDKISRFIFRRRARAVTQTIIKNRDLLFNSKYKKFGLICFPIEFFINIVFPFFVVAIIGIAAIGTLLLSIKYKFFLLVLIFFLFVAYRLLVMAWYQMISVITYLLNSKAIYARWSTSRYESRPLEQKNGLKK